MLSLDYLRACADSVRRASAELERAKASRDRAIVDALAAGMSLRKAADAAGVTFGRVRQIRDERKEASDGADR